MVNNDEYLITGCNDRELRVWKITFLDDKGIECDTAISNLSLDEDVEESVDTDMVCIYFYYIFLLILFSFIIKYTFYMPQK